MNLRLSAPGAAILCVSALASTGLAAQIPEPLFPIWEDRKLGLINADGAVVVPPSLGLPRAGRIGYNLSTPFPLHCFTAFLIPVSDGRSWGFMDRTGKLAIDLKFDEAEAFSEGLAAVRVQERWGFIDSAGRAIIPPTFQQATGFHEGVAAVSSPERRAWGYVDPQGNWVIPAGFEEAHPFYQGLAAVATERRQKGRRMGARMGYINHEGTFVVPPRFTDAGDLQEGMAAVAPQSGDTYRYGYIDSTGNGAIRPQFDTAREFSDGLAPVTLGSRHGYIDRSGQFVITLEAGMAPYPFSEGLGLVNVE